MNKIVLHLELRQGFATKLLAPETMELLRIIDSKVTKNKNYENVPHMEINKAALVHCDIANSDYEQDSKVLYTFVSNKPFDQVLDISTKDFMFSKPSNSEF